MAGDTLIIRVKTNGNIIYSTTLTITIRVKFVVRTTAGTIQAVSNAIVSGASPIVDLQELGYTTDANTFSVTAKFGIATSALTMNQLFISSHMPNGA